jgi:hypothetical protein
MIGFSAHPPRIDLNFTPRRRRLNVPGLLVLAAGLLVAGSVWLTYYDLQLRVDVAQKRLDRENRHFEQSNRQAMKLQIDTIPDDELLSAGRLAQHFRDRNPDILIDIEAATDDDIGVLSITQESEKSKVSMTVQARNLAAAFAFAHRLAVRPGFVSAQINSYEFKQVGAVQAVGFSLTANWNKLP